MDMEGLSPARKRDNGIMHRMLECDAAVVTVSFRGNDPRLQACVPHTMGW
jgi:hypothetical protein